VLIIMKGKRASKHADVARRQSVSKWEQPVGGEGGDYDADEPLPANLTHISARSNGDGERSRGNRRGVLQTTSNSLHQSDNHTYEDPMFGQEAIYTQAKIEKAAAAFEEPYAMLDSGAQTYVMGTTTATLA
jgi:hypothetical protein